MSKNLKIKRGRYDEIILGILRGGPRTSKELKEMCLEKGIPYSTYSRRINQLIKYEIIERSDIVKLSERIEEADPEKIYVEKIRPEKIRLQLKYVNERSFFVDLKIISLTLKAIIFK